MKGCVHDNTLLEDECSCDRPLMHTNSADAGLPHTSLTDHIADLEDKLARIERLSDGLWDALDKAVETMHKLPKTHACAVYEAQTKAALIRSVVAPESP